MLPLREQPHRHLGSTWGKKQSWKQGGRGSGLCLRTVRQLTLPTRCVIPSRRSAARDPANAVRASMYPTTPKLDLALSISKHAHITAARSLVVLRRLGMTGVAISDGQPRRPPRARFVIPSRRSAARDLANAVRAFHVSNNAQTRSGAQHFQARPHCNCEVPRRPSATRDDTGLRLAMDSRAVLPERSAVNLAPPPRKS